MPVEPAAVSQSTLLVQAHVSPLAEDPSVIAQLGILRHLFWDR